MALAALVQVAQVLAVLLSVQSEYCSNVRIVSARVSPLLTELNCTPWVIGMTLPPSRSIAAIKEALVRVLGS